MPKYFRAEIKNGKFSCNKDYFRQGVANMPDGRYVFFLMPATPKDTRECQQFYFAQLGNWCIDTGYEKEELHNLVKEELFVDLFGEEISTRDLTVSQWTILLLNLQNYLISKFEN